MKILAADDDPHIRDVLDFALRKHGHETLLAKNGTEALEMFRSAAPDLIILDVGMPELDGLEVCRAIRRESDIPILFLSARDDEIDRILGLEIGGDDYLTKPFSPRELVTRVGVIMRRVKAAPVEENGGNRQSYSQGELSLDPSRYEVRFRGAEISLTSTEFAILATFMARPDQVFDRDRMMTAVYQHNAHVSDRTIDSHIRNIRAKLAAEGCDDVVQTLHGIGFRLGPCLTTSQVTQGPKEF